MTIKSVHHFILRQRRFNHHSRHTIRHHACVSPPVTSPFSLSCYHHLTYTRPGDQHGPTQQVSKTSTTDNPFDPSPPRMSGYTAQEIATLSSRLEKQLGPEYISSRPGASGSKVHYIAAEKCINLANEVFGFNGWSSGIQNVQIDFVGSPI